MNKILVVGGAGYIGSHMVKNLIQNGFEVVVLDKADTHPDLAATWIHGNYGDKICLDKLFADHKIDAVMHFGAYLLVGESVSKPDIYYQNNFSNTLTLLDAMGRAGIKHFIFSSTAATFGNPEYTPIDEAHPMNPINPYGASKLMVERALKDYDKAFGLKSICLRYFNAAGADPEGEIGECHDPETHLIPVILQTATKRREKVYIFGDDYDTPDGTCLRDYIHVTDLCDAHLLALKHLLKGGDSARYNLGNGNGFSVKEVIDTVSEVTGTNVPYEVAPRRPGDPAVLIADSSGAMKQLGWQPKRQSLKQIIEDAWGWEQKLASKKKLGNNL